MQSIRETLPTPSKQFCPLKRRLWQRPGAFPSSLSPAQCFQVSSAPTCPLPSAQEQHWSHDSHIQRKEINLRKKLLTYIQRSYPWGSFCWTLLTASWPPVTSEVCPSALWRPHPDPPDQHPSMGGGGDPHFLSCLPRILEHSRDW